MDQPWRVVELNHLVFPSRIDIFKYVIYGIAAAFFVYGILLMVEGFFTTGAIKDLYGDFKITTCGRCVSAWVRSLFALRASCGFISVALWCLCSSARNGSNMYFLTQLHCLLWWLFKIVMILFSNLRLLHVKIQVQIQIMCNTTHFASGGSKLLTDLYFVSPKWPWASHTMFRIIEKSVCNL